MEVLLDICKLLLIGVSVISRPKFGLAHQPYRSDHVRTTSFETIVDDYALEGHVIKIVHEESLLDCGFACLETDGCQSYNSREEKPNELYECELNNSTKTLSGGNFVPKPGFTYFGSDTFPKTGCDSSTCDEGVCEPTRSYPFFVCPGNTQFDLTFPPSRQHNFTTDVDSVDAITICLWFKTISSSAPFFSKRLWMSDNVFTFALDDSARAEFPIYDLDDNYWHHVCVTWNSTSGLANLFIDGALRSYPNNIHKKGQNLDIQGTYILGYGSDSNREYFYEGKLSQVNMWNYVLPSDQIKVMAKNCTTTSGNVLNWARDFTPTVQDEKEQRDCAERDNNENDYDLEFPHQQTTHYAKIDGIPEISQLTISLWVKTSWRPQRGQILSLVNLFIDDSYGEAIKIIIWSELDLAYMDARTYLPPLNDNRWHHMAFTWDSQSGSLNFYLDGAHRSNFEGFQKNKVIPKNGTLVLGQEQDTAGGNFEFHQSFQGSLSRFNMWDKVLPTEIIVALAKDPGNENGNVVAWRNIQGRLFGPLQPLVPSTVQSSAGTTNHQLTFPSSNSKRHARVNVDGDNIRRITMCTWIDLSVFSARKNKPGIVSYATEKESNQFLVILTSSIWVISGSANYFKVGNASELAGMKWRFLCITWNSDDGYLASYIDGVLHVDKTGAFKGQIWPGKGIWVIGNDQDSYGGGLEDDQGMRGGLSQLNCWDYVVPVKAIKGLSAGGISVEGNLLRWSDITANRSLHGDITISSFQLYLPDAIVQKKRDDFCNTEILNVSCAAGPLYARVGTNYPVGSEGNAWRCYCKSTLHEDKNAYEVTSDQLATPSGLADVF